LDSTKPTDQPQVPVTGGGSDQPVSIPGAPVQPTEPIAPVVPEPTAQVPSSGVPAPETPVQPGQEPVQEPSQPDEVPPGTPQGTPTV
jgi:hypothetical protein